MSRVLLGLRYRDRLDGPLRSHGLEPLYLPDNPDVDPRLAGHADLSVFREGERVWLAPCLNDTNISDILEEIGYSVRFPNISQDKEYPRDAGLNLCPVGNHLIYTEGVSAPEIVKELTSERGYVPIPVRQGYVRCSCCVPDGESLITADRGIASAAERAGLRVLLISPGFVELPGFPYGFLGGASFRIDDRTLAFTGRLDAHPDGEFILQFLRQRGIEPVVLTDAPVFDIGGAFVLK